ncbi:MAG: oligosaccharide flippase family protein, partial [Ruminococcus sp.]|nr:oligosaccharide flippase family protein [Ruminococcus sp.]
MSTLKKNIAYNFLYQLLILILPLITAPYLARVIGPQGVGVYSFSYS